MALCDITKHIISRQVFHVYVVWQTNIIFTVTSLTTKAVTVSSHCRNTSLLCWNSVSKNFSKKFLSKLVNVWCVEKQHHSQFCSSAQIPNCNYSVVETSYLSFFNFSIFFYTPCRVNKSTRMTTGGQKNTCTICLVNDLCVNASSSFCVSCW